VDARAGTGGAPSPWSVWAALLLIYVVWGSTYLAIKVNVETLPPMLSGGIRFLVAGGILYLLLLARHGAGGTRVTRRELAACVVAGAVLLVGGVGMVMVAETRISSSLAAIIASSIALWIVILRLVSRERIARATVAVWAKMSQSLRIEVSISRARARSARSTQRELRSARTSRKARPIARPVSGISLFPRLLPKWIAGGAG